MLTMKMRIINKSQTRYNEEIKTLTAEFKNNGTVDSVKVISDGVTDAKSSKVDVEVVYLNDKGESKTVRYERSVKTGGVKQFGQVTAGGAKDEDDAGKLITREERYDLQEQFWNDFKLIFQHLKMILLIGPIMLKHTISHMPKRQNN